MKRSMLMVGSEKRGSLENVVEGVSSTFFFFFEVTLEETLLSGLSSRNFIYTAEKTRKQLPSSIRRPSPKLSFPSSSPQLLLSFFALKMSTFPQPFISTCSHWQATVSTSISSCTKTESSRRGKGTRNRPQAHTGVPSIYPSFLATLYRRTKALLLSSSSTRMLLSPRKPTSSSLEEA